MNASADRGIRGGTNVVGIIGWPVAHSLSPAIHNAAFAEAGLDWVYVPLPVPPRDLEAALAGLASLGFRGVNVTMPHKTEAADLIERLSEDARTLRAVNTISVHDGELEGHNTDAPGFDRFLRRDAGFDPEGRSALVYGAGGAARACALALARGGLTELTVAARDPGPGGAAPGDGRGARGLRLRRRARRDGHAFGRPRRERHSRRRSGSGACPPEPSALGPGVLVIDLLYDPVSTELQQRAREAGAAVFGGLGHLLEQAALAFELWTGTPAPLEVMSAAALAALAER